MMSLPNTYTSINEAGCCPVSNVDDWQEKEYEFTDERFIRLHTKSFMYVPLNMAKIMKKLEEIATTAGAQPPKEQSMILSRDVSPWKAEQYFRVSKPIEGQDNVTLSGTFVTKVYEGPFKNARQWYQDILAFAKAKGKAAKTVYFFYTTCPQCAKHYGKNYVVGLAEV